MGSYNDKYAHGANVQSVDMNGVSTGMVPHLGPMLGMPSGTPEMHQMQNVPFPMQHQNFQRHDVTAASMPMPIEQHMVRPSQNRKSPQMGGPVPLVSLPNMAMENNMDNDSQAVSGAMPEAMSASMSMATTQLTTSAMPTNVMTQMNKQQRSPTMSTFVGTSSIESNSMDGVMTSTENSQVSDDAKTVGQDFAMPVPTSIAEKDKTSDDSMTAVNSVLEAVQPISTNNGEHDGAESRLGGTHEI